jgi:hypothetical protein
MKAAMSLPGFFVLVTPFAALLCAIGEARDMKAGLEALIISAFVGLILGIGGAMCAVGFATKIRPWGMRQESKLVSSIYVLSQFFVPPIMTTVACVVTVWFLSVIL